MTTDHTSQLCITTSHTCRKVLQRSRLSVNKYNFSEEYRVLITFEETWNQQCKITKSLLSKQNRDSPTFKQTDKDMVNATLESVICCRDLKTITRSFENISWWNFVVSFRIHPGSCHSNFVAFYSKKFVAQWCNFFVVMVY